MIRLIGFMSSLSIKELIHIVTRELKRLGYTLTVIEETEDSAKLEGIRLKDHNKINVELEGRGARRRKGALKLSSIKLVIKGLTPIEETELHEKFIRSRGGG